MHGASTGTKNSEMLQEQGIGDHAEFVKMEFLRLAGVDTIDRFTVRRQLSVTGEYTKSVKMQVLRLAWVEVLEGFTVRKQLRETAKCSKSVEYQEFILHRVAGLG